MRKPDFVACEQQGRRQACKSAQSDQKKVNLPNAKFRHSSKWLEDISVSDITQCIKNKK